MLDLLLNHLTVVTMDDDDRVLKDACIGVRDGRIAFIGAGVPAEPAARTLDCTGKIAMPGLINTHAHAAMSLMRGYARGQTIVLYVAVILLVILVQIIQSVGTRLSIRTDKRINK